MSLNLPFTVATLVFASTPQPSVPAVPLGSQTMSAQPGVFDNQLAAAASFMRANGMSEKGVSTVLSAMRSEQREQWRIFDEEAAEMRAVQAAAGAKPFNSARFAAALKRLRDNHAAAFSNSINAEIEVLRALSVRDQPIFAWLMHVSMRGRIGLPTQPLKGSR